MLPEIALGTLAYMGADALQKHWGIWRLTQTWQAVGLVTRFEQVPYIVENQRTEYGRRVVVHLPVGISTDDFLRHLTHMEEQMRATIQATTYAHSNAVALDIIRTPLPTDVPFVLPDAPKMRLPLPIGATGRGDQVLTVDLAKFPHLLLAGNTGGGKSTIEHCICVSVLHAGAWLAIIDLKRVEYGYLDKVASVADTERTAYKLLELLNAEMDRRLAALKAHGAVKWSEWSDSPYIVVVIDELAELDDKDAQKTLNRLCRLSRAAGICIVAATQRPSHTLFPNWTDTRDLFAGRLCFAVASPETSRMVLGDDSASRLPQYIPGRAVFRWNGTHTVQCLNLSVAEAKQIVSTFPPRKAAFNLEQHAKVLLP